MKQMLVATFAVVFAFFDVGQSLAETMVYDCRFKTVSTRDKVRKETMNLEFRYDTQSMDGFVTGNAGTSPVEVYKGATTVTFQEKLYAGSIQTTSIIENGKAVHSRHTVFDVPGHEKDFIPGQHHGTCKISTK